MPKRQAPVVFKFLVFFKVIFLPSWKWYLCYILFMYCSMYVQHFVIQHRKLHSPVLLPPVRVWHNIKFISSFLGSHLESSSSRNNALTTLEAFQWNMSIITNSQMSFVKLLAPFTIISSRLNEVLFSWHSSSFRRPSFLLS